MDYCIYANSTFTEISNIMKKVDNKNKYLMLKMVALNGNVLAFVSDTLRNDRDIVYTAVNENWCALRYASDELRDDEEIVTTAIKQYPYAIKWASTRLRNTRSYNEEWSSSSIRFR